MRYKSFVTRIKDEDGQAIVLVAVAMSLFLFAAIGLAVDGSNLYSHRQMAQAAADAAAQAGIMSIFDGTNGSGTAQFVATPGTSFVCTTTDAETPCVYALNNGFGGSAADTVTVSFPKPAATAAPGVALSGSAPTNLIKVEVKRDVNTTLMRFLGSTVTTVRATAMAAIVDVLAPVPILVTHPTTPPKKIPPLSVQGTPTIKICGGPARSIQVNSSDPGAFQMGGNASVDLTHAGPLDDGKCNTGTGADFGTWGGPATNPGVSLGVGKYIEPSSPIKDPLAGVAAPPVPTVDGTQQTFAANTSLNGQLCPASAKPAGCTLLTPGLYPGKNPANTIALKTTTAFMEPGIYYVQTGGFGCLAGCSIAMASPAVTDTSSVTGTGTGWDGTAKGGGVLVYNSGTGQINIGASGSVDLIGSPASSTYKNILFFEDRSAAANTSANKPPNPHSLGGGGALKLQGTIYLTNTLAIMADPAHFQELDLSGNSGNSTLIQGEIIVGVLGLGGTGGIEMDLNPNATLVVQQVALVN
jgi:hypothetical protein